MWEQLDSVIDYAPDCDLMMELDGPCSTLLTEGIMDKVPLAPEDLEPPPPLGDEYILAVGDFLDISVFGDEEATYNHIAVAPDGHIYVGILDGIMAAGHTIKEVREELTKRLSGLYLDPNVSLVPVETFSQQFKIVGRVANSGVFPIRTPTRLSDAIGEAGGLLKQNSDVKDRDNTLNPLANLQDSFLVRNGRKLDIDFENVMLNPNSKQNIYIRPDDYIYIASFESRNVYVLGPVRLPRRIAWTIDLTLMAAMANANGWINGFPFSPDIHSVALLRGPVDHCCVSRINMREILDGKAFDIFLQPGDVVFVYPKTLRFGRELVRLAVDTFVQSFATSAGSYYAQFKWFTVGSGTDSDGD
jgi:polysaccharide export outer membrane protein